MGLKDGKGNKGLRIRKMIVGYNSHTRIQVLDGCPQVRGTKMSNDLRKE